MATLHVVTGDQYRTIDQRMRKIKLQLDQRGGSPLDPDRIASALQNIVEGKFNSFVASLPGLFIPPHQQLHCVKARNIIRKWGFQYEDFEKLGGPPEWPSDWLSAVVLDVGLDTVEQTFEEAWHCIVESQQDNNGGHWRWNLMKPDKDHLRLHNGIVHERGLCWRTVDFGAHWDEKDGVSPQDVRNSNSPHSAILWAASYFPKWIQAMEGINIPFVWIPGYQLNVNAESYAPWMRVPILGWDRGDREVSMSAYLATDRARYWAVPAL